MTIQTAEHKQKVMKQPPKEVEQEIPEPRSDDSVDVTGEGQEEQEHIVVLEVESSDFDEMDNKSDSEASVVKQDDIFPEDPHTVLKRIGDLDEELIGNYNDFQEPFRKMVAATKKIREDGHPYDSDDQNRVDTFVNSGEHNEIFDCLRGVYEFIFHLHNVFGVKLKPDIPDDEDRAIRYIIEDTCGKYNNRVKNI